MCFSSQIIKSANMPLEGSFPFYFLKITINRMFGVPSSSSLVPFPKYRGIELCCLYRCPRGNPRASAQVPMGIRPQPWDETIPLCLVLPPGSKPNLWTALSAPGHEYSFLTSPAGSHSDRQSLLIIMATSLIEHLLCAGNGA